MIEEATVVRELKSYLLRQGYQELPAGRWKPILDLLMKRKTVTLSRELMDKTNLAIFLLVEKVYFIIRA